MTVVSIFAGADVFVFVYYLARSEFAFVNPYFNADSTVGGMGSGDTVINVCTESLQRDGAFAVAFASSDFSAAQTAGNGNFDTLGTSAHGSADALFYSTAEADTSFELGSDVFADQDGAHVSGFDFQDVDVDFFVGDSSESFFDVLDACAATITYIQSGRVAVSGKKQALTGAYLSVQGPDAACGAALRARLIGARSHKGELDALIRAEDAGLAAGLAVSPANLEQIMVHLEREAEA